MTRELLVVPVVHNNVYQSYADGDTPFAGGYRDKRARTRCCFRMGRPMIKSVRWGILADDVGGAVDTNSYDIAKQ